MVDHRHVMPGIVCSTCGYGTKGRTMRITIDVPEATWEQFDDWLTDRDNGMPEGMGAVIVDYEWTMSGLRGNA